MLYNIVCYTNTSIFQKDTSCLMVAIVIHYTKLQHWGVEVWSKLRPNFDQTSTPDMSKLRPNFDQTSTPSVEVWSKFARYNNDTHCKCDNTSTKLRHQTSTPTSFNIYYFLSLSLYIYIYIIVCTSKHTTFQQHFKQIAYLFKIIVHFLR